MITKDVVNKHPEYNEMLVTLLLREDRELGSHVTPEHERAKAKSMLKRGYVQLMLDGKKPVGYRYLMPDEQRPERLKSWATFVVPEKRRTGIYRKSVFQVLAWAKHNGFEEVEFVTLPTYLANFFKKVKANPRQWITQNPHEKHMPAEEIRFLKSGSALVRFKRRPP
jgi:hypothetical protein